MTLTKGWSRRSDSWKSERATTSLPVPLSPRTSTVMSVSATCSMMSRTSRMRMLSPQRSRRSVSERACSRRRSTSRFSSRFSSAFWKASSSSSTSKGLRRKSEAPRRMASTMFRAWPWPESITTGTSGSRFLSSASTARPSMPGNTTSRVIRSGRERSSDPRASSPSAAANTS